MKTPILILAAGASLRMGKPKQLLPWGTNTLLENAINSAKEANNDGVYVILGANKAIIKEQVTDKKVTFITNSAWESGLGSSIAVGMQHIAETVKVSPDAILIMLADQPFIDASYLNSLLKSFKINEKSIVATSYGANLGVPALFDASYFKEILKLNKDFGAKELIAKNKEWVSIVFPYEKAVDIDTPSDYKTIIKKLK